MPELTDLKLFGATDYLLDAASFAPDGVRGADKVAQRFVYALYTPSGSVPGSSQSGSPFPDLARNFRSEFDLFAAFAAAYAAAVASTRAAESAAEPDSEKFGSATLDGIAVAEDAVTLQLTVTALDGSVPAEPVNVTLEV